MNSPEQNNYIQYVNQNNIVKTKSVIFVDNGTTTTFTVRGINENFFIVAVFQNNIKVTGVGFDDIENNDMLGFINSNFVDLSTIPSNAFLNSEQVVTMSYNNDYLSQFTKPNEIKMPDPQVIYVMGEKGEKGDTGANGTNGTIDPARYFHAKISQRNMDAPFMVIRKNTFPVGTTVTATRVSVGKYLIYFNELSGIAGNKYDNIGTILTPQFNIPTTDKIWLEFDPNFSFYNDCSLFLFSSRNGVLTDGIINDGANCMDLRLDFIP